MTTSDLRQLETPFLEHLKEEGMALSTVSSYATDLRRFLDADADITLESVNEWLNGEAATHSTPLTFRRRSALRRFFSYVSDNGYPDLRVLLCVDVPGIRRPPRVFGCLSEVDVLLVMMAPFSAQGTRFPHRDAALIRLLYECGLASSEAVRLRVSDIDIDSRYVNVDSVRRPNPGRSARFSPKTADILSAYLISERAGRPVASGHDRLWVNASGWPLVREDIWGIVRNHGASVGLAVNPRILRSSRAVHLLRSGVSPDEVAALLGLDRPTLRAFKEAAGA